jgi:hypothetical protein
MERILTVENVQISTVTVQLKSLTVGHKQVTQAVFWQLLIEPVIDSKTGKLLGIPWGHVNYFSSSTLRYLGNQERLHIVWQKENELRRFLLKPNDYLGTRFSEQTTTYRAELDKSLAVLRSVPQLFIAV